MERKIFKQKVIESVQSELTQFGLRIYNANVKELQDTPGSEYFSFLSRKAHEGALNQAKVDVADARMRGEVGEAEKQGKTKQEIAKIHAATAVLETERKGEKATADAALTAKEIQIEKNLNLDRIEAKRVAEQRDAELQKTLEQKRAEMELERLRATKVTAAKIERESTQERADAELYTSIKQTDAKKYKQHQEAEAKLFTERQSAEAQYLTTTRRAEAESVSAERHAEAQYATTTRRAEAEAVSEERRAEASFVAQKKRAEGLTELARAYGDLAKVFGGPQGLLQFLMLDRGLYVNLAEANAKAINGLQPKINVWNTGAVDGTDALAPIRNLMQSLPPILSTIQDQTGIQPPSWLAQMPQQKNEALTTEGRMIDSAKTK